MAHRPTIPSPAPSGAVRRSPPRWRLEEAPARFSEVVRLVPEAGPQHITLRGRDAVVVLSAEDYARIAPAATALAALFGAGPFTRLDTFDPDATRERTPVRDALAF
jgi:prevent-host-death family protein